MNTAKTIKPLHPWAKFLVELLTARAGVHVVQDSKHEAP